MMRGLLLCALEVSANAATIMRFASATGFVGTVNDADQMFKLVLSAGSNPSVKYVPDNAD